MYYNFPEKCQKFCLMLVSTHIRRHTLKLNDVLNMLHTTFQGIDGQFVFSSCLSIERYEYFKNTDDLETVRQCAAINIVIIRSNASLLNFT